MKNNFSRLLVSCLLLPFSLLAQNVAADPVTGNAPISFYGKVVDQDGNPV